MAVAIRKKPVWVEKKTIKQATNSFNIRIDSLDKKEQEILRGLILVNLKRRYEPAKRADDINFSTGYGIPTISGHYDSNRKETEKEYKARKLKFEKDTQSYNSWLQNNREKIKKELEKRTKELESVLEEIETAEVIEQYSK